MRRLALLALVAAGAVLLTFACSSSDDKTGSCADGDRQQCTCASGATGTATCTSGAFGACACAAMSSSGGTGGGGEGGAATYDGGFGNYLGACGKNEDCPDGGTCFNFNSKGMICTHTCTANEQCEAPSPKCNPKGVCAIPDAPQE